MTIETHADILHDRLCQIEDELVVTLVCTPDGKPPNSAMVKLLDRVQELRCSLEAKLEERESAESLLQEDAA